MARRLKRTFLVVGCVFAVGCGSSGPAAHDAGDAGRVGDGGSRDLDAAAAPDVPVDERADAAVGDAGPLLDAASDAPADGRGDGSVVLVDAAADAGLDARDGSSVPVSRAAACGRTWLWDWSTPGSAKLSPNRFTSGTPTIDTARDELLLPFDSQEFGTTSAVQYVLEFDLEIDGDLTFAVRESTAWQVPVPSITRSGGELILSSLTGDQTAPGGFFTGQRIPAERVHVTLFGFPYHHLLGMKVDSSHGSFWSGFAALQTPPQELFLMGADLSAERGTAARVHVGPMSGCERSFDDGVCLTTRSPGFCPTVIASPL
jgi:hypothetical protein